MSYRSHLHAMHEDNNHVTATWIADVSCEARNPALAVGDMCIGFDTGLVLRLEMWWDDDLEMTVFSLNNPVTQAGFESYDFADIIAFDPKTFK